jgi:pyridoxine 4-dehydrogenase
MSDITASKAGTFRIGGEIEVNRLGFGAMRITGPGVWGEPLDRGEAIRTLKRLPELGVNFIDTADSYGPDVSEQLIRETLHPYEDIRVGTKAGLMRTGPNRWIPNGSPEYLIQEAHKSRRRLGVETIALWQLHRIDPRIPRNEQFRAIQALLGDGVIQHVGLSEVSVAEVEAAMGFFKVATVQNRYNLTDRRSESVLDFCARHEIGFIPWNPLGDSHLAAPGSPLDRIAKRHGATCRQVALAWLLNRSPVMLPIPGTSRVEHLEENVRAAEIELSEHEFLQLDVAGKKAAAG